MATESQSSSTVDLTTIDNSENMQSDPPLNQTPGWMLYTPGSISIQCINGIYINATGMKDAAAITNANPMNESARFPEGWGFSNGDVVISSAGSLVMWGKDQIYAETPGPVTITSDGDMSLNSATDITLTPANDMNVSASHDISLTATHAINITTPGECSVSIGSLKTMLDNALTNVEAMASVSSIPTDIERPVLTGLALKNILGNIKAVKASLAKKTSGPGGTVGETPSGRPRSNAVSGESNRPNVSGEASDVGEAAMSEEEVSKGVGDFKGGIYGLLGIVAGFLTTYSTMAWGGFSTTAIGNGSTTVIGNGSLTVVGLNSNTYVGESTTSYLGEMNEVNLAEAVKSGLSTVKSIGTTIVNAGTTVVNKIVSAVDSVVNTESTEVNLKDVEVAMDNSAVKIEDSDVDLDTSEIKMIL